MRTIMTSLRKTKNVFIIIELYAFSVSYSVVSKSAVENNYHLKDLVQKSFATLLCHHFATAVLAIQETQLTGKQTPVLFL